MLLLARRWSYTKEEVGMEMGCVNGSKAAPAASDALHPCPSLAIAMWAEVNIVSGTRRRRPGGPCGPTEVHANKQQRARVDGL